MVELFTKVGYTFGGNEPNEQAGAQTYSYARLVFVILPDNEISTRHRIGLLLDGPISA